MNAYYLTGIYRCAQVCEDKRASRPRETIEVWDAAMPVIAFSTSPYDAERLFESELRKEPEGNERPREITIRKVFTAPIIGQLLTESGNVPLNWQKVLEKSDALLQSTPVDDFEQGYWVDVDTTVRLDKLSFSLGTLQSDVPEGVRSGLNWSGEKQFFFLLQVRPLPPPPAPPVYEGEEPESKPSDEPTPAEIADMNATLPETVALIQARNSVAAAWLWRRYAVNTQWKTNPIRITALCGTIGEPG